jgi:hypothetical protein
MTTPNPQTPPQNAPSNWVPKKRDGALPSVEMLDQMQRDAGKGVSFDRNDILTPLLRILQSNSPQVLTRDAAYLAGAEPGHWWARNALNPVISGETGMRAVHCGQRHTHIEYLPDRGGFVAKHDIAPPDLIDARNKNGRPIKIRSSNKNTVEHVREIYFLLELESMWLPYVFGCASTQHTFAREFQTHIHQYRHPNGGGVLPSFARTYQLTTFPDSNALGNWFAPKFIDLDWTTRDVYDKAREFAGFVEQGSTRGDYGGEYADAT